MLAERGRGEKGSHWGLRLSVWGAKGRRGLQLSSFCLLKPSSSFPKVCLCHQHPSSHTQAQNLLRFLFLLVSHPPPPPVHTHTHTHTHTHHSLPMTLQDLLGSCTTDCEWLSSDFSITISTKVSVGGTLSSDHNSPKRNLSWLWRKYRWKLSLASWL